jgi:sortase (surface protein transpeptidase)
VVKPRAIRRAPALGLLALALALGGSLLSACGSSPSAKASVHTTQPAPVVTFKPTASLPAHTEKALVAVPKLVSIPRLGVSARVVAQVRVQTSGPEKGLLSAPRDFHLLGWYDHENKGVLVIDGHVGYAAGAGPLAYIGSLSKGNSVTVKYATGKSVTYAVADVVAVKKGGLSPAYFSSAYNGDIMLITCDYQSAFHNGHFADNVFVIAKPSGR